MREYISSTSNNSLTTVCEAPLLVKAGFTNRYFEQEIKVDEETYLVLYMIPRDEHSIFVAANVGNISIIFNNISKGFFQEKLRVNPTLKELIENGMKQQYSKGVLMVGEDLDTGDTTFFVASIAGNLDLKNPHDWVGERSEQAMLVVMEKYRDFSCELANSTNFSNIRALWGDIKPVLGKVVDAVTNAAFDYITGRGTETLLREGSKKFFEKFSGNLSTVTLKLKPDDLWVDEIYERVRSQRRI